MGLLGMLKIFRDLGVLENAEILRILGALENGACQRKFEMLRISEIVRLGLLETLGTYVMLRIWES